MVILSLYFHERADVINFITQECRGTPLTNSTMAIVGFRYTPTFSSTTGRSWGNQPYVDPGRPWAMLGSLRRGTPYVDPGRPWAMLGSLRRGTPLAEFDHAYRGISVHAHVLFHDRQVLGKPALRRSGSPLGYARFTSNYSSFTVTLAPDHPPQLWHSTRRCSRSHPHSPHAGMSADRQLLQLFLIVPDVLQSFTICIASPQSVR